MSVKLVLGTEAEHRATLERARKNGVSYIWSGEVRRSPYLAENLDFAIQERILEATPVEEAQESGWRIKWL
jgi:hypothetical protein